KEIIDDFLGNLDKNLIYESALRDAKKKLSSLDKEDKYTKKKKLLNYLYRKGYPFDISSSVVDTLL
ncbi:MAG TPA: RecX family transcriptional regulator, partial [bacterium]|nr:RecX family transcriptional regulator [bacterium]